MSRMKAKKHVFFLNLERSFWSPTTVGILDFTLMVQDSGSVSDTQPLSLTVDSATLAGNSDNSNNGGGALGGWLFAVLLVFRFYRQRSNLFSEID